jgi:adenosylmethionine-8-amino-7-oxononanoate aminotransferase
MGIKVIREPRKHGVILITLGNIIVMPPLSITQKVLKPCLMELIFLLKNLHKEKLK